mgnify:CR=1 FL=1
MVNMLMEENQDQIKLIIILALMLLIITMGLARAVDLNA